MYQGHGFSALVDTTFAGEANYCSIHVVQNKHFCVAGNIFLKNPSEFDKQKGFSTVQCVVDYKNVNCLDKQNGFCIAAAAKYCVTARERVK